MGATTALSLKRAGILVKQFTPKERRILTAAASAHGRRLTPFELAEAAGTSVEYVLERLQNDAFRHFFLEVMRSSLVQDVPEVLDAVVTEAKMGSFQHAKLVLELTSFYEPTQRVVGDITLRPAEQPFESQEARVAFVQRLAVEMAREARQQLPDISEVIDIEGEVV